MQDERMKIIEDEVEILGEDDRCSESFQVLAVIIAAIFVGRDLHDLVSLTGYLPEFVAAISHRMSASGLWENGVACREDLFINGEWLMIRVLVVQMVAQGSLTAHRRENGDWEYSATAVFLARAT